MKARFEIGSSIFSDGVEAAIKEYKANYYEIGYVLDTKRHELYKDFDISFILSVGDMVEISPLGLMEVKAKWHHVDIDTIEYTLEEI